MKRRIASIVLAILLMVLILPGTGTVQAAGDCVVGSPSYPTIQSAVDDSTCSQIDVPSGVFFENVEINRDVTIQGDNKRTIVYGDGKNTVFIINGGTVSLQHMTITHGIGRGGGIFNNGGIVSVQNINVSDNAASAWPNDLGGGIFNYAGSLIIDNSNIIFNTSTHGGGIMNTATLIVRNSTISNNVAYVHMGGFGGGIYNDGGTVTVENSTIHANDAASAGGVFNYMGELAIQDSTISYNSAEGAKGNGLGEGGGIYNETGTLNLINTTTTHNSAGFGSGVSNRGLFTMRNSLINSNTALHFGGGVQNFSTMTIKQSTIAENSAQDGGGIYNFGGTATINDSALALNAAKAGGGGVYNENGTVVLNKALVNNNTAGSGAGINNQFGAVSFVNTTISGNEADTLGGGIFSSSPSEDSGVKIINSTLSYNKADFGGGIFNFVGKLELSNTIVSLNEVTSLGGDCSGNPITSHGYNLDSDDTCNLTGPGDISNADPLLGPLQDNGGPTLTHALLPGSPAIDAIDPVACPPPETDQRGITRPEGISCDIGAYEAPLDNPPTTTISIAGTVGNNGWYRSNIVVTLSATDDSGNVGVLKTEYGFAADPDVIFSGPWYAYTAPIQGTLEGSGYLVYRSIDQAGNIEPYQMQFIGVDKTPPAVHVIAPQSMDYLHSATFYLLWKPFEKGSGLDTSSTMLDGQLVTNGQVVDLFFLNLGPHTVTVQASDRAGNSATITVPFNIVVDIDSLRAVTKRAYDLGWINKQSTYNNLDATLRMAKQSIDKGQYRTARRQLLLFIAQLRIYNGKSINQQAYDLLRTDGLYVLLHLP